VGLAKPGESPLVRAALGRPVADRRSAPVMPDQVAAALRGLPSDGWTRGMFGRRDRCLLVLSHVAGVPYQHLASVTAGDVTVAAGTATITTPAVTWTLHPADDSLLCGPCAVTRWLRILNLVVTRPGHGEIARALKKAKPGSSGSPHLCRSTKPLDQAALGAPLLPPIDQWGYLPFPVQRLTAHSLSRRVRDLLAGDLGAHRELPVDTDDDPGPATASPPPVPRAVYSREDSRRAWAKRRADLDDLAGVDDLLSDVDARARELDRRTAAILVGQTRQQ